MTTKAIGKALLASFLIAVANAGTASAETIKIGVIAPLTGAAAKWGQASAGGPKLAADEINANGGLEVGGKKYDVEVIAYDDHHKAADAVAAYSRLVHQDNAKFVIVMASAATLAIKQNVEDDKIIALTSSLTDKAFDEDTKYMFRLYSPPPEFLESFIAWMKDNMTERRILVVNPNDETGWVQTDLSEKIYADNGFEVIGRRLYERSTQDFQALLTEIVAAAPEIIDLSTTPPTTAGIIVRQARELGYKGTFVQTGAGSPYEIIAGAGNTASEGIVSMVYANPKNDDYRQLVEKFHAQNGQAPDSIIVSFYDATNLLMKAIQDAGSPDDVDAIKQSFAKVVPVTSLQGDELTMGGASKLGMDHQVMSVNYISVIKNGEPTIVAKIRPS